MRVAVVLALLVSAVLALSVPAAAHDDQGVLAGEYVANPPDAPEGNYRVRLTFQNDGHPAEGATVTMSAADGTGGVIAPTPMSAVDAGEYEAAVSFPNPGAWTVTVVASSPAATFEQALTIAEPPASTTTSTTKVDTRPIDASDSSGDGGGIGAGLWIGIVATLIAAAVVAFVLWRRRVAAP
ncbi:MAG: hypothetical protein ACRDWD_01245 [Acidimicrobiia bacterium]